MSDLFLRTALLLYLLYAITFTTSAQDKVLIHSHNDYHQTVPFYQAYAQQLDSYEADVYYDEQTQQLLVAHDKADIRPLNTLENLYILPIVKQYRAHGGKAWQNSSKSFYLLIDIKEKHPQLIQSLLKLLQAYPEVFDKAKNAQAPTIVLTGSCPSPDEFENYPPILYFDGRPELNYTPQQLSRIAFISDSFRSYSVWNGKGSIKPAEKQKLMAVIEKAHQQNCKIRFWASPDNVNSWQTFRTMEVDIVNTDKPELCAVYFKNEAKNNFRFSGAGYVISDSIKTDRLDKTTGSFKGFSNTDVPARPITVYQLTGKNDGANKMPLNIILLIGDGMGVAQLSAVDLINRGLSTTQIKYMGLQRTQPKGNFITDSAGAGSALATGVQTSNRHIATTDNGEPNTSLTELLQKRDKRCGVVTNGNIADATPAAFYAHATERDNADSITAFLMHQKLWFLAGSGESVIANRKDGLDLKGELLMKYNYYQSIADSIVPNHPSIIIDEALAEATTAQNLDLLATTTQKAIQQLVNKKGFFLMVEGAKIDYAGHANSVPNCITEMLGFDLAVKEALRFADTNGQTLVLVTGDHETGGLTIVDGNTTEGRITGLFTSDDHTPVFLPVFAYGPGAQYFTGVYNNTAIFSKISSLMQLK